MTTFNGYYIWGIYLLQQVGFIIDKLFYGGQFVDLPRAFSLVSYGFLGLMSILPVMLFRRQYKLPAMLLLSLLILYVPLRSSDYAIIGTIGNLKFAFFYVAFLLICYRHTLPDDSKKVYFVDFCLLVCAYTDIVTYPLLLAALYRYWPNLSLRKPFSSIKDLLLRSRSFQSLVGLGILLLPQLVVIALDGIPTLPGYLTSGFNYHRLVEIFISRSYFYGLLFPLNRDLDNVIVVILFLVMITCVLRFARRAPSFFFFVFGIAAIFLSTYFFVSKRTGVSAFFIGYQNGGPDQFFYPQNWVFDVIVVFVATEFFRKLHTTTLKVLSYAICLGLIVFWLAPNASAYGLNVSMAQTVGNIYGVAQSECKTSAQAFILPIYPIKGWVYPGVSRQQLCTTDVTRYQPETVRFGIVPYQNNYHPISNIHFTQTFTSPANNLSGIDVYFSTFAARVNSPYNLLLYGASCKQRLAIAPIHTHSLLDNEFATVSIPTITQSKDKSYCFTIAPSGTPISPLAIQLSAPGAYPDGITTINGKPSGDAVVFGLHYKN